MDDPASMLLALLVGEPESSSSAIGIAIKLAAVLFCVAINGYFVGAEFALVAVRRTRLEAKAAAGSRRAASAVRLLNDPTLFINASQLGITIASLALGWLGEPTFAALVEPIALKILPAAQATYLAHLIAIIF
ncbi:MAG TPA: CNNM domain-containing protein, partial [Pyrinomonadaceae bacterium]|nr:CNNM domain-containing protein [Pyrinomonadaceae bacterium]